MDFVILLDRKPQFAVEVKLSEEALDLGLKYFLERVGIPHAFQISLKGEKDYEVVLPNKVRVRILPAAKFLGALP